MSQTLNNKNGEKHCKFDFIRDLKHCKGYPVLWSSCHIDRYLFDFIPQKYYLILLLLFLWIRIYLYSSNFSFLCFSNLCFYYCGYSVPMVFNIYLFLCPAYSGSRTSKYSWVITLEKYTKWYQKTKNLNNILIVIQHTTMIVYSSFEVRKQVKPENYMVTRSPSKCVKMKMQERVLLAFLSLF